MSLEADYLGAFEEQSPEGIRAALAARVLLDAGADVNAGADLYRVPPSKIEDVGRGVVPGEAGVSGRGCSNGGTGMNACKPSHGVWMRRRLFLFAIGVSVCSAVVTGNQAAPSGALAGALRTRVQNERFSLVTSIRGLPLGVRTELQTLFGGQTLDIAEMGGEFQGRNVRANSKLPSRRLVAAGCSYEYCLVYYERGGNAPSWRAALFHWAPEATRFEWGGMAPGGLTTIDEVRRAVLSGAIRAPAGSW